MAIVAPSTITHLCSSPPLSHSIFLSLSPGCQWNNKTPTPGHGWHNLIIISLCFLFMGPLGTLSARDVAPNLRRDHLLKQPGDLMKSQSGTIISLRRSINVLENPLRRNMMTIGLYSFDHPVLNTDQDKLQCRPPVPWVGFLADVGCVSNGTLFPIWCTTFSLVKFNRNSMVPPTKHTYKS